MGGAGRLTDAFIDRIQNNYGEAIRNNNDVLSMKTAIRAIYEHMIKDNELSLVQQHMNCPKTTNTWWQDKLQNKGMYTEDSRLPSVFKSELKYLLTSYRMMNCWSGAYIA